MERQWVQVRRDLHQIPEIGYQEYKTQGYLESMINRLPQEHLHVEKWKTGLFVLVKGIEGKRTIGYRADIDGLPIKEDWIFLCITARGIYACLWA